MFGSYYVYTKDDQYKCLHPREVTGPVLAVVMTLNIVIH